MPIQKHFIKSGTPLDVGFYQSHDELGRISSQKLIGSSELDLRYNFDLEGNLQSYSEGNQKDTFTYDFANRLESWTNNGQTVTYRYDLAGNLENPNGKSFTFNSANEVQEFEYDDVGNLLIDDKYQYDWNNDGNLVSVKNKNGTMLSSFTYFPDGLRKTKTVGEKTYSYHYDGTDLIRITDQNNQSIWAFTWVEGLPNTVTNSNGQTFFYITNYRGDVVKIIDDAGKTVANYSYDLWGNIIQATEQETISDQPIGYAGYYYDRETKLYYLQARYYDPSTARFISRDPYSGNVENDVTQNGYVYADDNPINNIDPNGFSAAKFNMRAFFSGVAIVAMQMMKTTKNNQAALNYLKKTINKQFKKVKDKYDIKFNSGTNLVIIFDKKMKNSSNKEVRKKARIFAIDNGPAKYKNNKTGKKVQKSGYWHYHLPDQGHYQPTFMAPKGFTIIK